MITFETPVAKTLGATSPGELIRVLLNPQDEPSLCIVLINDGTGAVVLGVLPPAGSATYAFHLALKAGKNCISFGQDWFLKPELGRESWVGNRQHVYWPGSLHLQHDGWVATFKQAPEDYRHSELLINLSSNELADDIGDAAPFLRWQIWQSRELFDAGHPPLATIEAAEG